MTDLSTSPSDGTAPQRHNREPTLHGTASTLRPLEDADTERIAEILSQPVVARWWPRYDAERVRHEFIEGPDTTAFAVVVDDEIIGAILYAEEPSPDYRSASVDVFLDPRWHGQGLGTDAIRTLAKHLFHDRGHHRLAIDPAVDNVQAIRTYKRVGFREVGVMRSYERGPDGRWHDGLMMDLLERDLH